MPFESYTGGTPAGTGWLSRRCGSSISPGMKLGGLLERHACMMGAPPGRHVTALADTLIARVLDDRSGV